MKAQDRYEHKESKAPVFVMNVVEDRTGFQQPVVVFRFMCDAGNDYVYSQPQNEFLKSYQPGDGEF